MGKEREKVMDYLQKIAKTHKVDVSMVDSIERMNRNYRRMQHSQKVNNVYDAASCGDYVVCWCREGLDWGRELIDSILHDIRTELNESDRPGIRRMKEKALECVRLRQSATKNGNGNNNIKQKFDERYGRT
jgi:hypothetical protein